MSLLSGFFSLSRDINKSEPSGQDERAEGVVSDLLPELELEDEDADLITLSRQWEKAWTDVIGPTQKRWDENENYWLGKQFGYLNSANQRELQDNLIFESLETFLPIATRQKPEPIVDADDTPEGKALADRVRKMLIYLTDELNLNLQVKQAARYWSLYLLGTMKIGWSYAEDEISLVPLRPQKLILDPEATIVNGVYTGSRIGEYRRDTASDLVLKFPKKEKYITEKAQGKMETKIQYIEWWTPEAVFWKLDDEILAKSKNPHWNYETQQPALPDQFGAIALDENGQPQMETILGNNHFKSPRMPYIFLSVFNLGKTPFDDTNLIEQNLALQDLINKRLRQIDKNADNTNGGLSVSGDYFTKEQAGQAGEAFRKGGVVYVPTGDVNKAIKRETGDPLPQFVYESLQDYRNELRNIFGTRGSSPQGTIGEETVRGKVIIKGQDTDRIGGGISVFIEQFIDQIMNYMVQMMYVYYDTPHTAKIIGAERAMEYSALQSSDFIAKLSVSIKEGSMIPRDPLTQRNEAVELWSSGAIDPITFFERLDFPNPREAALKLFLWKVNPAALFGAELGLAPAPPAPEAPAGGGGPPPAQPAGAPPLPANQGLPNI